MTRFYFHLEGDVYVPHSHQMADRSGRFSANYRAKSFMLLDCTSSDKIVRTRSMAPLRFPLLIGFSGKMTAFLRRR